MYTLQFNKIFLRYVAFLKKFELLDNKVQKNLIRIQKAVVDTKVNQLAQ